MHSENCFITLTYSDDHLVSPELQYRDFQLFMKRLRWAFPNKQIGCFVTGEYGERTKRPHWHAILFGYRPTDSEFKYQNERGDTAFSSESLEKIWGQGIAEFGDVTFHSAGYVARYAAKKLVHGNDRDHDYQPISKKSNKHAIGKKWLEKNWRDLLAEGNVRLENGQACPIPRYYVKWLIANQPDAYLEFLGTTKQKKIAKAMKAEARDRALRKTRVSKNDARREIQKQRFDYLQSKLKL